MSDGSLRPHKGTKGISLINKSILVIWNCMVSMTTHYVILQNAHIPAATYPKTLNLASN